MPYRVKGDNHTKQPSSGDKYNHTTFSGFQVTFHRNCAGLGFVHSYKVVGSGPETLVLGQYVDCLFYLVAHDFLGGPVRKPSDRLRSKFLEENGVLAMDDSPLVSDGVFHDSSFSRLTIDVNVFCIFWIPMASDIFNMISSKA